MENTTQTPVTEKLTPVADLKNLSADQLAILKAQILAEEKAKEQEKKQNRIAYKDMVEETVNRFAPELADFGKSQTAMVNKAFEMFRHALDLKKELYGYEDKQASHTFTTERASITIGYNEIISFNGTQSAGVAKIREFISSLAADDENRGVLADLLETFMKPNKKGELNPTRVAELIAKKDKIKDPLFHEGVDIIVAAQFKSRTSTFVKGWVKEAGEDGQEKRTEFTISTK
ncbi:hypothetical protein [Sphingobacterium thalpophilum]|uniref:hypothetical protein n=1 Tax=Sphingobacterium thalpophilum TaxID=259 RepID=UPI0024A62F96|nr:hypothetical protein [Sphingobacterium thalpophilum]